MSRSASGYAFCPDCNAEVELTVELADNVTCPRCGRDLQEERTRSLVDDVALTTSTDKAGSPLAPPADGAAGGSLPPTVEPLPESIGRFRIERVLGQGGYGTVYLAHDDELMRHVAVKAPRRDRFGSAKRFEAFLAEARTAARLRHASIVTVHDVGRLPDGSCYIVLDYVEGGTLGHKLARGAFPPYAAAQTLARIAEAVAYANQQGLIHRDLKPSNILLDADDQPYVADFGLAEYHESPHVKTAEIVGTPSYMAPEQIRGENHRLDARTDVWALGVMFYFMLTGQAPFTGGRGELFEAILRRDPPRPHVVNPQVPRELERICLRCLAKRMSERYVSNAELASELRTWLRHMDDVSDVDGLAETASESHGGHVVEEVVDDRPAKIIPKGLRSFGSHDAHFFLNLLPGPRDRDGLPESIRFWKLAIDAVDVESTFNVGLLYGPSGCGKSSFLKAGLIPRLAPHVESLYLEAAPQETEVRLAAALRRKYPGLAPDLNLTEVFVALRDSELIPAGQKLVIVIDQFEQFLQSSSDHPDALVRALRHCDGTKVQCLLAVRDDFGMAAARFLGELEVAIVQGKNFATIDRFSESHARHVLAEFGRAFSQLPDEIENVMPSQERFLSQAVEGLVEDGKVIPVRLALFAEMVKDRPWRPQTLDEVGGAEGVGVAFLDETFTHRGSNPKCLRHQAAARRVLHRLLPEQGTHIRGARVSRQDLLAASAYGDQPREFAELLQLLDSELRLITPVDPDDAGETSQTTAQRIRPGSYYQLTHDYLVPALRSWLTRCQRETRRGRAELLLAERSAAWATHPESRQLPGFFEWVLLRGLTRSRHWTAAQAKMMRVANQFYYQRMSLAALMVGVAGLAMGWIIDGQTERQNQALGQALAQRLMDAESSEVDNIIDEISDLREYVDPLLLSHVDDPTVTDRGRLHARLGLLPMDASQVLPLFDAALSLDTARLPLLMTALRPHVQQWHERAATCADDAARSRGERLNAFCLLAGGATKDPRWSQWGETVVRLLSGENPLVAAKWAEQLRPVRDSLREPLHKLYVQPASRDSTRSFVAGLLADYFADDPAFLANLVYSADPVSFVALIPALEQEPRIAIEHFLQELQAVPQPVWPGEESVAPGKDVAQGVRKEIESAGGQVAPGAAFCQTLAAERFVAVCESLEASGYRPHSLRPYLGERGLMVAAAWWRDGRQWQVVLDVSAEELLAADAQARKQGLIAYDVALTDGTDETPSHARFAGLWGERGPGVLDGQLYAQVPEDEHADFWKPLNDAQYVPRTNLIWRQPIVSPHYSSVRWQFSEFVPYHDGWEWSAEEYESKQFAGLYQADARVFLPPDDTTPRYSGTWWNRGDVNSRAWQGHSLVEHQQEGIRLLAEGWRPAVLSLLWQPAASRHVIASVWHRPEPAASDYEQLARRQALAAAALCQLGRTEVVWPLLHHTATPRVRAWLIHYLARLGIEAELIWQRLAVERDASARRALLLALAEYSPTELARLAPGSGVADRVADIAARDTDAGVHAAAERLLARLGTSLESTSHPERAAVKTAGQATWHRTAFGHTMVELSGPVEFWAGSPPGEPLRDAVESMHRVRIPRSFAISAHEVTIEQFLRCDPEFKYARDYTPDPDCPITMLTVFDAMRYCRWLSEQEGIPEDEMCYPPLDEIGPDKEMVLRPDLLERSGYRLPTDLEWEYACRAGTSTSRYYGSADELLGEYAWTAANSQYRAWPVGRLKPNDFGLFDMLGNAMEMTHAPPNNREALLIPVEVTKIEVDSFARLAAKPDESRVRRGGAFLYQPSDARSAHLDSGANFGHFPFLGFRLARTLKVR